MTNKKTPRPFLILFFLAISLALAVQKVNAQNFISNTAITKVRLVIHPTNSQDITKNQTASPLIVFSSNNNGLPEILFSQAKKFFRKLIPFPQ